MKTEKDLTNRFKKVLPTYGFHVVSLESSKVNSAPDLLMAHQSCGTFLVEVKAVEDYDAVPDIRKGQPQWIEEHCKAGGKVVFAILIRKTQHVIIFRANNVRAMVGKTLMQWQDQRLSESFPQLLQEAMRNADVAFASATYRRTTALEDRFSVAPQKKGKA